MMPEPIIEAKNLSKRYVLGMDMAYKRLTESITDSIMHPIKTIKNATAKREEFWALKDVSFKIEKGDVVGIIGRNGAGKSTLLKILSQITWPTEGEVILRGRVGSLLEVGTGFHPELSGRENIYLNGAILGMKKKEIDAKFEEIVKFAEIDKFLDTPVKRYSSGMYVRLAFAVAAHMDPEILLVDEVLAVGDAQFQKKCLGKMKDVSEGGRTVLFVSHNMGAIAQLCTKCILLEKGRITSMGNTQKVIDTYLSNQSNKVNTVVDLTNPILRKNSLENSLFKWTEAKIVNSKGLATSSIEFMEPFDLVITGVLEQKVEELHVAFDLKSGMGVLLFNSIIADTDLTRNYNPGTISFNIKFDPNLLGPGLYTIGISAKEQGIIDWIPEAITFNVEQASSQNNKSVRPTYDGLIVYPCKWSVQHSNKKQMG